MSDPGSSRHRMYEQVRAIDAHAAKAQPAAYTTDDAMRDLDEAQQYVDFRNSEAHDRLAAYIKQLEAENSELAHGCDEVSSKLRLLDADNAALHDKWLEEVQRKEAWVADLERDYGARVAERNKAQADLAKCRALWEAARALSYSPHCQHDTEEWHDGKCLVCNAHEAVEALRPLFGKEE